MSTHGETLIRQYYELVDANEVADMVDVVPARGHLLPAGLP